MQSNIWKEPRNGQPAESEDPVRTSQDYRKLGVALLFAAGTLLAWTSAVQTYNAPVGMLPVGDGMVRISLAQVDQYVALFSDENLRVWPPEPLAAAALWQRTCYRFALNAALVCGLFTVFCLGLQLEALRRGRVEGGRQPDAQSDLKPPDH